MTQLTSRFGTYIHMLAHVGCGKEALVGLLVVQIFGGRARAWNAVSLRLPGCTTQDTSQLASQHSQQQIRNHRLTISAISHLEQHTLFVIDPKSTYLDSFTSVSLAVSIADIGSQTGGKPDTNECISGINHPQPLPSCQLRPYHCNTPQSPMADPTKTSLWWIISPYRTNFGRLRASGLSSANS